MNVNYLVKWKNNTPYEIKALKKDSGNSNNYLKEDDLNIKKSTDKIFIYNEGSSRGDRKVIRDFKLDDKLKLDYDILELEEYLLKNKDEKKQYAVKGLPVRYTNYNIGTIYFSQEELKDIYNKLLKHKENYFKIPMNQRLYEEETEQSYRNKYKKLYYVPKKGFCDSDEICIINFTMNPQQYTYVKISCVSRVTRDGDRLDVNMKYIPSEIPVEKLLDGESEFQNIQWTLNGNSYDGFVSKKDLNTKFGEIKRPRYCYETSKTENFFPRDYNCKHEDKIVVYNSGDRGNRKVKELVNKTTIFLIENLDSMEKVFITDDPYKKGIPVKYLNDKRSLETGFIYPDYEYNLINSDMSYSLNKKTIDDRINKTISKYKEIKETVTTDTVFDINSILKLEYSLSPSISLEKTILPKKSGKLNKKEEIELPKDYSLGYAGYTVLSEKKKIIIKRQSHSCKKESIQKEVNNIDATSVHFELFTDNVKFMQFKDKTKYSCKLLVKEKCPVQPGNLTTVLMKKVFNVDFRHLEFSVVKKIEMCYLKKVSTVSFVKGEIFYGLKEEGDVITLNQEEYIDKEECFCKGTNKGLSNIKAAKVYDSKGRLIEEKTVPIIKNYLYEVVGEMKGTNLVKVNYFFEKSPDLQVFYVSEETLNKLYFWNDFYIVGKDTSIKAEEMYEKPVRTKWTEKESVISDEKIEYMNIQQKDSFNNVWEQVRVSGTEKKLWIQQKNISTEEGAAPVRKIIYDDWEKFFTKKLNLNDYGTYVCDKKQELLDKLEFDFMLEKDGKIVKWLGARCLEEDKAELLHPVYFLNETEWNNSSGLTQALIDENPSMVDAIEKQREDFAFWNDIKSRIKSDKLYFFNPPAFLNHVDKVSAPQDFNPYEGKTYNDLLNGYLDPIYGNVDINTTTVISNPGITTIYNETKDNGCKYVEYSDGKKYSGVNGFFNAQYKKYHSGYTEYWHEGIDFRGKTGATVISLINGIVVKCGKRSNVEQGFILLQSAKNKNLYYLALHVDHNNLKVKNNDPVYPGMELATTVYLPDNSGTDVSHLHVSVIKLPAGTDYIEKIISNDNSLIAWGARKPNQKIWKNMINPFNYNDPNTWKGRY